VVAAVGISEISDGPATFTVEGDAVTVDLGQIMLVGYASVHPTAMDGDTVRFVVDFPPEVVSADDVEAWISWELGHPTTSRCAAPAAWSPKWVPGPPAPSP
jgi:hypothetical protein